MEPLSLRRYKTPWGVFISGYSREGTNDENIFLSSVVEDEYCIGKLPDHGVAVDLGAHIGAVSMALASRGWDVIAFEMLPDNAELATKNVLANKLPGLITLYRNAVAKEDGKIIKAYYLNTSQESGRVHKYIGTIIPTGGVSIEVKTITLETIFKENRIQKCDFLKADIEGAEWQIFENISEEILDKIDRIAIELDGTRDNPTNTGHFLNLLKGKFIDVSKEYFPKWCSPGTWVHGYYINKNIVV